MWQEVFHIELQPDLLTAAARLAEVHLLRCYGAVQLAAAMSSELRGTFAAWDGRLRTAAAREGFNLIPPSLAGGRAVP